MPPESSVDERFAPFAERMRFARLPDLVVASFRRYYGQLVAGETGLIPEASIEPVSSLPDAESLPAALAGVGAEVLDQTVILKLNGGLGTSMGLDRAKSLLVVREGLSFLEVAARQSRVSGVPLVLMDSFATHDDSLSALRHCPPARADLPLAFCQHRVPKVMADDLTPARCPEDPGLEWCPPGHGDLYASLVTSGMLEQLLEGGYRYAFVSNVDNLGAVLDPAILGHLVDNRLPFLMEVADRTEADRKGGHLARRGDGKLLLREVAQCPTEEIDAFQDTRRYRYFNTNSLWLDLIALAELLAASDGALPLPMVRNVKTLDPRRRETPRVYQIETAMGAAIELFEGAAAIRVPRTRFAPVKTTEDLLKIRSDLYRLTEAFRVVPGPDRRGDDPVVRLDPAFYALIDDLDARFPHGPPSLRHCRRLEVKGDIRFGRGIVIRGSVELANDSSRQRVIADGTVLEG